MTSILVHHHVMGQKYTRNKSFNINKLKNILVDTVKRRCHDVKYVMKNTFTLSSIKAINSVIEVYKNPTGIENW